MNSNYSQQPYRCIHPKFSVTSVTPTKLQFKIKWSTFLDCSWLCTFPTAVDAEKLQLHGSQTVCSHFIAGSEIVKVEELIFSLFPYLLDSL